MLAGDHLKSASDLGLPLVGVGLLYQEGYFRQYLNIDGWQQESYPKNDFYNLPITLIKDENGNPKKITVEYPGRTVYAQIWKAQVGRVPLYLMDTNITENNPKDRAITAKEQCMFRIPIFMISVFLHSRFRRGTTAPNRPP